MAEGLGLPSPEEAVSNLDLDEKDGKESGEAAESEKPKSLADRAAEDNALILIGDDDPEEEEGDIWERVRAASDRERSRRATAEEPVVVITNKNLAEMAEGGRVTFVRQVADETEEASTADPVDGSLAEMQEQEIYWRQRAREIRLRLKVAWDEVGELEERAAKLRTEFYSEDDPFTRDGKIKPQWDHTLDLLDEAEVRVDETQRELEVFMEEGRRAGALPGWLREGAELIPPPVEKKEIREAEVGEPPVVESPP